MIYATSERIHKLDIYYVEYLFFILLELFMEKDQDFISSGKFPTKCEQIRLITL